MFGIWSRGVARALARPINDGLRRWLFRSARRKIHGPSGSGWTASISPRSAASRSVLGLMPSNSAARVRFSQDFDAVRGGTPHRNAMMGAQRRHTLTGPAIAVAREELVAVQNARNEIVIGDAHQ